MCFSIGSNPSRLYLRQHDNGENQTERAVGAAAQEHTNENAAADATHTKDSLESVSGDVSMTLGTSALAVDNSVPVQV